MAVRFASWLVGVASIAIAAGAQPGPGANPRPQPEDRPPISEGRADPRAALENHQWSSPSIEAVARLLVGSWRTTSPVPVVGGEGEVHITMHIAPVLIKRTRDCLYVEVAREDQADVPYRSAIFQLLDLPTGVRIRTYEIAVDPQSKGMLAGLWAAPEAFPRLDPETLIATCDIDLTPDGDGYRGKSPHPYPTRIGGALEMTSEITLKPDAIVTRDRGVDAQGNVVWGASGEGELVFEPFDHPVRIVRRENGWVMIDWITPEGHVLQRGDLVEWAYEAWIRDSLDFIQSSDVSQQTAQYIHPNASLIRGWKLVHPGTTVGSVRTVIIPPADGFPNGEPRMGVPRDQWLIYHLKCLSIIPAADLPPQEVQFEEEAPEAPPQGQ